MMRLRFQQGLDELKQKLLSMGGLAEQAIDRAMHAYRQRDTALCQEVLRGEEAINRVEREIDELALDLLAMQQPMATDLRFILAVIKINSDLERVGDQAVNVSDRVSELAALPAVDLPVDLPRMAALAGGMIRRALEAFVSADPNLAQAVLEEDDTVDRMNDEVHSAMLGLAQRSPASTPQAVNAILVARNLERIADHATNIAEDVIFWVRGADVRHHLGASSGLSENQD
jgi:phosphate transport system protein